MPGLTLVALTLVFSPACFPGGSEARARPLNIAVPARLKPWAVRVANSAGKDDIQQVMSDCSDAAKATAAVLAFERTMRKARTTCLA